MPVGDIRLRIDFRNHPKTKRMMRTLGDTGVRALVWLWLGAAARRGEGELYGWDVEEIETEAEWSGEPGVFVAYLLAHGWLEQTPAGLFVLHDWKVEQPYVIAAPARAAVATNAAKVRWEKERASRDARSMHGALLDGASSMPAPDSSNPPYRTNQTEAVPDRPTLAVPAREGVVPGYPQAPVHGASAEDAASMVGTPNFGGPTEKAETLRAGPGGALSVVPLQVLPPGSLALVALAYEASGMFPREAGNPDFANCGLFRTWVEEWLETGRPAAHIGCAIAAVAVAWKESGGKSPSRPIYAIRSLVENHPVGAPMAWDLETRTAGDGTSGRRARRAGTHDARSLLAKADELEAEGK